MTLCAPTTYVRGNETIRLWKIVSGCFGGFLGTTDFSVDVEYLIDGVQQPDEKLADHATAKRFEELLVVNGFEKK